MIPSINDAQLRASAEALSPRYQPRIDEIRADVEALENWLNACRVRIRAGVMHPDGSELRWGWGCSGWLVTVTAGGVTQSLRDAPPEIVTAAFPRLVDLVRLIAELARAAGE